MRNPNRRQVQRLRATDSILRPGVRLRGDHISDLFTATNYHTL